MAVTLILSRFGKLTTKDGAKGEWGMLCVYNEGRLVTCFDSLERRGGYVKLNKGDYLLKKHTSPKVGGLKNYQTGMGDKTFKYNSLWVLKRLADSDTPDSFDDDTYEQLKGKSGSILIHAANKPKELEGCIAPGERNDTVLNNSRNALMEIFKEMGADEFARLQVVTDPTDE